MIKNASKFLLLFVLIVVSVFAFAPGQWTPAWVVNHDKFVHLLVFFTLSIMLSFVFPSLRLIEHLAFLMVFAFLIEVVQYLFVGRGFSVADILYDVAGAVLFYFLVYWVKNKDRFMQFAFNKS